MDMAIQWDPHSAELSGWEQGVINGQHCNLKFAFIFRHGISVTIRDRDDLHMGQTVRMKIRRRAAFNPNFSSQHNAEEVFVTSRPPSLLDVKGLFLKALMDPSIDRQGRSLFYDRYIGNAFDTDHKVPDHISRQEKTIVVDLLAKKCEDDQTKSYLKIVHYYGQYKGNDIRDESVGTRTRDSHEALIRRVSGSYYYALSPGKTEELKIRKELLVAHENWLGKWISFEETHRMSDGSIELLKPKLSSVQHSGIAVNGDIVNVRLDCEPLRMENGVQIYTTKGAGNMVDTFHILDTSERNFPCSLWLEPELNHPSCLWRVSREKESPDVSTNKQSSRYEGCILTANSETCWIYCKDVLVDVIADIDLIKDIKDPIGKWVSFPEPIKTGSKAQIRGQIALLENDLINTRVRHNVPELEVACTHYGQNESDGSQVLCSEEVGDVVVIGEPIIRRIGHIQLPSKLWVVKHKEREGQYRSRWKLSYENNFNSFRPLTNTSLDHIGCITTVMGDVFFASCKDFERDLLGGIELIKNLKDPLGKWITFPPPTGLPSKLRIRGPVDPLQEPLVKTRVAANIVELEVKLISQEGNESDGKNAFWTDELGTVVDCDNKLDRLSLPVTVWVIEHRNELHRSRWMIRSISPTALLSEPNETTRFKGIIVNEKDGLCWILCTQLPRNTILQKNLIGNTTKVLGKWVEFSIIESSRQGYVCADDPVLLEEDVYPTRLYNQTPEICVEIYSLARQEHEGMVFEGEAGTVLDSMHIFSKNVSYPFKCWITYVKDKAGMPRWKISPNNNLREIFSKPPNHLQRAEPEVQRTEDRFEDVEWLYDSDEEQPENEPTPTVTHYEQQRTQCNRTVMSSEGRRSAPIAQSNPMTRQSTPQYLVTKRGSIDTVSIRSSPFERKAGKEDLSYDQKSLSSLCEDILEDPDLVNAFQQMNPGLFNAFERATSHARHSIS